MQIQKTHATIEGAGALSAFLNKFSNIIDKFFDKLGSKSNKNNALIYAIFPNMTEDMANKYGYIIKNQQIYKKDAGGGEHKLTLKEYPFRCKVTQSDDSFIEDEEGNTTKTRVFNFYMRNVLKDEVTKALGVELPVSSEAELQDAIDEQIAKLLNKSMGEDEREYGDNMLDVQLVEASESLKLTLHKITSATAVNVDLVAVSAGCNPIQAQDIIQELLDDEFIEVIPEDADTTYVIDTDLDSYEVVDNECIIDHTKMFNDILAKLYQISLTTRFLSLSDTTSTYCAGWEADGQIEWFTRASKRYNAIVSSPITLMKSSEICSECTDVKSLIDDILTILDLYWCNFDKYDQQTVTGFIQSWRQSNDYLSII